ncbi:hypothetical protein GCM10008171_20450 [Methylopila jiangsuensis]|uniref:Mitochondrial inner membrane protein n=1 Tax=Methylopila jiangsuensis TaxID=586230 RepID=A0A9W6JI18_9HYPH|nr:hypothetical protein [Methylopila jiangsuensis]MDR6286862.1 hypothetical protein [Methylopila jiangsuensis]GLK76791.1 hypothetical protein GCM10008171_20450 [Methylopila jiangsuensis]
MADPKGPEQKSGGAASSARPRPPVLDLPAADVTSKTGPAGSGPADAKPADAKPTDAKTPDAKPAATAADAARTAGGPSASPAAKPADAPQGAKPTSGPAAPASAAADSKPSASEPLKAATPGLAQPAASSAGAAKPGPDKPSAATPQTPPQPSVSRSGAGPLGLAVATLMGAAIAVGVVALYGRDLIGVSNVAAPAAAPDMSRVAALESKLDGVAGDLAALRDRAAQTAQTSDTSAIDARIGELGKAVEGSNARFEGLEREVRTLAERPAEVSIDTKATDALAGRLDALEEQLKAAPTSEAMTEIGQRLDGVAQRLEALGQRLDGVSDSVQQAVAPIAGKIDAVESELKARPVGDPDARLVVALGALEQAIAAGRPFTAELAVAKSAGGDVSGGLEAFAADGAPTPQALAAELRTLMDGLPPLKPPTDGSVLDRLLANAGSIVKVTPTGVPAGSGPEAARARVSALASRGDLSGALAARDELDDAAKAATAAWAEKAQARLAANAALNDARQAAFTRLGAK